MLGLLRSKFVSTVVQIGGASLLLRDAVRWFRKSYLHRDSVRGWGAVAAQVIRVGARAIGINALVSGCVGFILALQMAPALEALGGVDLVPNIIAVAVLRELGPLISGIVMTGFAGAAIAAELGTMVVGEEIEALEAHALNPVRFLVVPRIIAVLVSMTVLAVLASTVAILAGLGAGALFLDIPPTVYVQHTLDQVGTVDFLTGLIKAAVFGVLIALIACHNGLRVSGGAAGVGDATTGTVVQSVVCIIFADLLFTAVFYATGMV